jgi:hypothetical protein
VIENVWASGQVGFGLLLKSENQDGTAPWTQTADVTVRYNRMRNFGSGINIAANSGYNAAVNAARISIYDNTIDNIGIAPFYGDGIPLQILGATSDVLVAHNSWSNAGLSAVSFDGAPTIRTVLHSNIIPNGIYGVKGASQSAGSGTISYFMPGGVFSYDAIIGANCGSYPLTTTCPSSFPSSPGVGYDARTIGHDASKISAATSGAIVSP